MWIKKEEYRSLIEDAIKEHAQLICYKQGSYEIKADLVESENEIKELRDQVQKLKVDLALALAKGERK